MTGPNQGDDQQQPGPPPVDFTKQNPGQPPYGYPQYGPPPYGYAPQYGPPPYGPQPYGGYGVPGAYGPPSPYGMPIPAVTKPLGWFVVNWLFFWPLALYSTVSAWQNIDTALFRGDIAHAKYQADRVKKFGIIGLCVGLGLTLLGIILQIVVFATVVSCANRYSC